MEIKPKIEYRKEQPYAAIRAQVGIPFGEYLPGFWGESAAYILSNGSHPSGPPFIRYLTTDMEKKLDIEVGFPIASPIQGNERIVSGTLPAGRYAVLSYFGDYSNLVAVTAQFLLWAEENQIEWEKSTTGNVEWWAARMEWYPTDPANEPDSQKWETELAFLIH